MYSMHGKAAAPTSGALLSLLLSVSACSSNGSNQPGDPPDGGSGALTNQTVTVMDGSVPPSAASALDDGRDTFRFDTFGDEAFWTNGLKLNQAIDGTVDGGGGGLTPKAALAAGLKVDVDALPSAVVQALKAGQVNLDDPATTLTLLDAKAVVGVIGTVSSDKKSLTSVGITCALCHSTVDDSLAPGIGHRLDGWPNRDLNVGAVISLAPDLSPLTTLLQVDEATVRKVLAAWGPGKFDAELLLDGKGFRPDGATAATLLPPAYGLAGVNLHTYTAWGSIPYWNAFVAVLEMHGSGNFFDARLDDAMKFPVAARARLGHVQTTNDRVTPKLAGLHFYELSLPAPTPAAGSFDAAAAMRGQALFDGQAKCSQCHVPPLFTDSGWNVHAPSEIGIDDFQANRSPSGQYRTTPLRGVSTHGKGGYYHDGRFATLADVVTHYDQVLSLGLSDSQKNDLVEYLKSL